IAAEGKAAELQSRQAPYLCWRCQLRICQSDFTQLMSDIAAASSKDSQLGGDSQEAKRVKLNGDSPACTSTEVCSACLGILATLDRLDSDVCDLIANAVAASGHSFTACRLLVSSPIVCLIRDHAWQLAKAEQQSVEKIKEAPISAKDLWKALARQAIERRLLSDGSQQTRGDVETIPLQLALEFRYADDASESDDCLRRLSSGGGGGGSTRHGAASALASVSAEAFKAALPCPPAPASGPVKLIVAEVSKELMFVGGRYRKLCRRLPQTPWILDGERRMDTSVEELISPAIVRLAKADSASFASAGREDVDVRMLGRGRPFLLRLLNPRVARLTAAETAAVQAEINAADDRVQVSHLCQVNRAHCEALRAGESEKVKCYSALCRCTGGPPITAEDAGKLSGLAASGLVLEQSTPVRVLHRRTVAVRKRRILSLNLEPLPPDAADAGRLFRLRLRTEAGAYVKEFVHGDLGRTRPSLGELLGEGRQCDLLLLDVVDVELDWPHVGGDAAAESKADLKADPDADLKADPDADLKVDPVVDL
ncbi:hypothetical protein BOX15_Mlig033751g2, partial [Macrostomum lignano]